MRTTSPPSEEPAVPGVLAKRPPARPRRASARTVPWALVDELLVFGQAVGDELPGARRYPTLRELGDRFRVSPALIWQYSSKHKCVERRRAASLRTQALADELRCERIAIERALATADVVFLVEPFRQHVETERPAVATAASPGDTGVRFPLVVIVNAPPER